VDFDVASSSLKYVALFWLNVTIDSTSSLDAKGNTAANTPFANPLHREGANRHIQAGRNSAGENEVRPGSSRNRHKLNINSNLQDRDAELWLGIS
jgi:hypothetical protein